MRAVLFANGEMDPGIIADDLIKPDDYIVSVDGGMRHIQALGLKPQLLIGDLDSIEGAALDKMQHRGGPVTGINTAGLAYPLKGETLYPDRSRGLSNVLTGQHAEITIGSGRLLCIHTRSNVNGKEYHE